MTLIRPVDRPTPLDISSLHIGPPLDAEEGIAPRGLVAVRDAEGLPIARGPMRPAPRVDEEVEALLAPDRRARIEGPGDEIHVRHMTPRQMLAYSEDLYAAGIIAFEDYEAMAFQPELHPDFIRTIGALTGDKPQPDRPRDFIHRWEDRLDFAQRYRPANSHEVRQAHRILNVLRTFQRQGDVFR